MLLESILRLLLVASIAHAQETSQTRGNDCSLNQAYTLCNAAVYAGCSENDTKCICSFYSIESRCFISFCPGEPFDTQANALCSGLATSAPSSTSRSTPSAASATTTKGSVTSVGVSTSASSKSATSATAATKNSEQELSVHLGGFAAAIAAAAIACL